MPHGLNVPKACSGFGKRMGSISASRFSAFCWFLLPCPGGMRCTQGSSLLLPSVKRCKPQALISQSKVSVCSLVWGFNACKSIFHSPTVPYQIFKSTVVLQSVGKGMDSVRPVLLVLAHRWVLNQAEPMGGSQVSSETFGCA